jgi:hypothetical protein
MNAQRSAREPSGRQTDAASQARAANNAQPLAPRFARGQPRSPRARFAARAELCSVVRPRHNERPACGCRPCATFADGEHWGREFAAQRARDSLMPPLVQTLVSVLRIRLRARAAAMLVVAPLGVACGLVPGGVLPNDLDACSWPGSGLNVGGEASSIDGPVTVVATETDDRISLIITPAADSLTHIAEFDLVGAEIDDLFGEVTAQVGVVFAGEGWGEQSMCQRMCAIEPGGPPLRGDPPGLPRLDDHRVTRPGLWHHQRRARGSRTCSTFTTSRRRGFWSSDSCRR